MYGLLGHIGNHVLCLVEVDLKIEVGLEPQLQNMVAMNVLAVILKADCVKHKTVQV